MQLILKRKKPGLNNGDKTLYIDEGSTYTENYNETLDSAIIRVSHQMSQLDIEPFDKAILHDENGNLPDKYMCVDSYTETMESLDPYIYSYEISLFSETKELENTLLPNLCITKPSAGFRSIWYYLDRYLQMYAPKIRMRITDNITYTVDEILTGNAGVEITEDVRIEVQEAFKNAVLNNTYQYFDISVAKSGIAPLSYVKINNTKIVVEENDVYVLINVTHRKFGTETVKVIMTMTYNYYSENETVTLVPAYKFSLNVFNLFKNSDCPEMQWSCPTLREVLNNLMMVKDCIVVLRNGIIEYINLTEKKNAIDTSKVNYIQRSQSSEDYVSELKMDMLNVMQTSLDGVKQTVNRMEYQTFKAANNGYLVTSENIILKTEYPILKINHLWMICQRNIQTGDQNHYETTMFKVDLCNMKFIDNSIHKYVYEYQEYSVLPQRRYNPSFNDVCQNNCVYFHREGNIIEGWTDLSKIEWLFNSKISTREILTGYVTTNCYSVDGVHGNQGQQQKTYGDNLYFSTFFIIEYETTADAVFKAGKDIAPSHHREVTDNQTNAYVDAYNQGFMEYQKVNRLGNHQLYINARYEDDFDDIIKIGDYYNDSIIYQTQYQIYKNHIEVNATATKDYILRDYFTGVKARIRSWKIADATQSLTRHDLNKYYLEFSKSQKEETVTYNENIAQYFLSPLFAGHIRPLKYCIALFTDNGGTDRGWYSLELLGRIIGNSILFTFGLNDNFAVGKTVANLTTNDINTSDYARDEDYDVFNIKKSFTDDYGGVPLKDVQYVDNTGEFRKIEYKFAYGMNDDNFPETLSTTSGESLVGDNSQKTWMLKQCQLPYVAPTDFNGYLKYINTKTIYKDNREMPKLSTQFELCADTHDIIFTRKFLELQECVREVNSEEAQTTEHTTTKTISPNEFTMHGGPQEYIVQSDPPFDVVDVGVWGGSYSQTNALLIGVTLQSVSIANTVEGYTNTVSFNSSTGTFSGYIYTPYNNLVAYATVTYQRDNPNWIYQGFVYTGNAGQIVTNIRVSGFTPGPNDTITVTFMQSSGAFKIYIKTYTQPISDINLTITYDLTITGGNAVANLVKIYQDDVNNFNWRNPTLGSAQLINDAYLSFVHGNKNSKITINGVTNNENHVYYITTDNDEILLAVKGTNIFYFNILMSRDYNIYDNDGNVIGNI